MDPTELFLFRYTLFYFANNNKAEITVLEIKIYRPVHITRASFVFKVVCIVSR